ncbi:hypothetical protein LXA43DRAFT_1046777 [Ganoderma leucocontextum]|nr:hypothetical protein LXA43DRAFT_1046777 [Ganoderma leucocontextum]
MLVACAASVFHLADPKILPLFAATNATIVSLVAPAHDAESERRSVVQAIVDEIERDAPVDARWPKAASKWIWWRADMAASGGGQETSCHLHTEAGLMALACKARLTCDGAHESDEDRSVFLDLTRTPIGISGKSCPLCLRLAQLLNAHFSSLGNSEAFVFPHLKTHGKVLPWDPPQFGIPKSVLTQLRDELRRNLVEKAIAVANPPVPEVDTSDEDEHDEDILAIHDKISLPDGFEW